MTRLLQSAGAWLAAIAAAGLPAAALGAQVITLEDACNGRQLTIQGPIRPGDYARFADRLARLVAGGELPEVQDPDVLWTIELDSPGGDPQEAMRIGRLLRQALATTEVGYRYARRPDGVYDYQRSGELVCLDGEGRLAGCHQDIVEAECTGACLLIWLAGAERHANEGKLGLHGLGTGDPRALEAYLREMGVAPSWITRLLTRVPEGDGWLTWPERHELAGRAESLRTLLSSCPAPLDRDESFRSIAAADPAERDRLMDRADAHRLCRRRVIAGAREPAVARLEHRLALPAAAAGAPTGR